MRVVLSTFFIAGVQYSDGVSSVLYKGEMLLSQKEPNNLIDKYAISIYKKSIKLGYIPQHLNIKLYNLKNILIEVEEYYPDAPPWERILVSVFLEE
jgi:sRNA-binding regulator protein Hfq